MYKNFKDLESDVDVLYEEGKLEDALNLLEKGLEDLPKEEYEDKYFSIMWNKNVLYTMSEKHDESYKSVEEVINKGYAFPLQFDRFKPLQERDGYEELLKKNNKLMEKLKEKSKVKYEVHLPENYDPKKKYPLFIGLHGDGICNIEEFSQYWKPDVFLTNDFIFAYLQSSQVICHNGYGWLNDAKLARQDIKECYEVISKKYSVDQDNIIIGGFSGGAQTTLEIVMDNTIPIKGFIGLCAEEKTESFTKENVKLAAERGVKGVLLEGELVLPMESEEEMMKEFDEVGLQYEYYINKGVGHNPPEDFDEKLIKSLDFIMN